MYKLIPPIEDAHSESNKCSNIICDVVIVQFSNGRRVCGDHGGTSIIGEYHDVLHFKIEEGNQSPEDDFDSQIAKHREFYIFRNLR